MKNNENIKYYNLTFSISELINQINQNRIILEKSKYRKLVWDTERQSLFIDSLYRDFPTPAIFLYEDEDNNLTVIDGIQRLRTIYSFYNNSLKINCYNCELNNLRFCDLSQLQQRRILNGRISVTIIEYMWNSSEIVAELFYRLNTGGTNLTNQEFRNRMFFGTMIDCINNLNTDELWRLLYNRPIDIRYKDSEFILKFFTAITNMFTSDRSIQEQMNEFIKLNRNDDYLAEECKRIFKYSLCIISEELTERGLSINGRFSSILFDTLLIPLGIILKTDMDYNLLNAYNAILELIQQGKLQSKNTNIRIKIGLELLVGDLE